MHEPASLQPSGDPRLAALLAWVRRTGRTIHDWSVASADASSRRYFRLRLANGRVIAMDAPPDKEDSSAFVRIAGLLRAAGVNAPRVLAADLSRGFLLLDDLGHRTMLDGLVAAEGESLLTRAIDALVQWQAVSRPDGLPPYNEALLRRELRLFPDWYLQRHLGWSSEAAHGGGWAAIEDALVSNALAQPCVYVHRDYMARNLMRTEPFPGVIDFQDAVYGPVTYDIVSLLRDAFWEWPASLEEWCFEYYFRRARAAGVPVPENYERFRRDLDWMGAQRHLKVLGIFARLCYRDGKPRYLAESPRFLGYLRRETADGDLPGLGDLLDTLGAPPCER